MRRLSQENSIKPDIQCPACGMQAVTIICKIDDVPVHSVKLEATRAAALEIERGNIHLGFCDSCGFIFNVDYDPTLHKYDSDRYESTQAYSATFNEFHNQLAEYLIEEYDLREKTVIEIGCGQGEFLDLLAELGNVNGIGFDPAYLNGKSNPKSSEKVRVIKDYYSEKYAEYNASLICCKMTLEHIHNPFEFVNVIRKSVGQRRETIVFFQVPDVTRILREIAFWDIYYEHCSYFSPESLGSLFRKCGFKIIDLRRDFGDQYLMIEALPGEPVEDAVKGKRADLESHRSNVEYFSNKFKGSMQSWKSVIRKLGEEGKRAVIWGAGSKGVAFLSTLRIKDEIEYAVDINPRKHNTFMAGSGQEIVPPQFLRDFQPHTVFIMNPIYTAEISASLSEMGLSADLIPVE